MIIQNVLEDWLTMRYDLSLARTAAVVHLQSVLMTSRMLHYWMTKLQNHHDMRYLCPMIDAELNKMKAAFDLREDIWAMGGYNIEKADQGTFDYIEERKRMFSCFRDFLTTTSTTQMGQGSSEVAHIDMWDVPLMPKDGRNLLSQPDPPAWDFFFSIRMMNDQQQREVAAQRARQEQENQRSSTGGPGGSASSSAGPSGGAPPKSMPKPPPQKPRPSTPPPKKDWVIAKVPDGYRMKTSTLPDHRNSDFITSAWMND